MMMIIIVCMCDHHHHHRVCACTCDHHHHHHRSRLGAETLLEKLATLGIGAEAALAALRTAMNQQEAGREMVTRCTHAGSSDTAHKEQQGAAQMVPWGWVEPFDDRKNELVFIGVRMNRGAIVAGLDRCLVTRVEASRLRAITKGLGF